TGEWPAVTVSTLANQFRVFAAPRFKPLFLFSERRPRTWSLGHICGLEMIAEHQNYMHAPGRPLAGDALPHVIGKPSKRGISIPQAYGHSLLLAFDVPRRESQSIASGLQNYVHK